MIRTFEAGLVVNACTTNNTNIKQGSHHARQGTPLLRPRTAFPMRRHLLPSCRLAHRIFAVTRLLCVVPGARQLYARAQRSGSTVLTLRRSTTCCCPPPLPPSPPSSHLQSAGLNFHGCPGFAGRDTAKRCRRAHAVDAYAFRPRHLPRSQPVHKP